MELFSEERRDAVRAVQGRIDATRTAADQHEAEALRIRNEIDESLARLNDKEHRTLLDRMAAEQRSAQRERARADAMQHELEIAHRAELDARKEILEAEAASRALTYSERYNAAAQALIALLQDAYRIDSAIEKFNADAAGYATIETIESRARRKNGRLPRSLFGQVELPDFFDNGAIRVPGTYPETF